MKISKLYISKFRGINEATLYFEGHTLMVGKNNVGKSTMCEALDLVLGPDRLNKLDAIDEYDFYNGAYYYEEDEEPKQIIVEATLTDISEELQGVFRGHMELWHPERQEILAEGEIEESDEDLVEWCLRLKFIGQYDREEDEFVAKTYFSHSPNEEEGIFKEIPRSRKRQIGFLYLRALRTGRRALSLERGTLLDILLRVGDIRPKFWEETRGRLENLEPPLEESIGSLREVLNNLEQRIGQYIPLPTDFTASTLHVSQLTRDHLRKTLSFFMSSSTGQNHVPFQKLGTGTLSTLVFAMLSAIAELKKENIIFAMEEPEIAVPPHTQRRIISYLLGHTTQSFVTSHSPYVIEMFDPSNIKILKKGPDAKISGVDISYSSGLKPKSYRRKIRHAIAEVILGNAVIVGEGLTEMEVLTAAAKIMESDENNYPFDLSGVTIFEADGDGTILKWGSFFKSIGLETFAFFDFMDRSPEDMEALESTFDFYRQIDQKAIEHLLVEEIPVEVQWTYLNELKDGGEFSSGPYIPEERPTDSEVQKYMVNALKQKKGERRSASLIEKCTADTIPATIKEFLEEIFNRFKQPEEVKPIDFSKGVEDSTDSSEEE